MNRSIAIDKYNQNGSWSDSLNQKSGLESVLAKLAREDVRTRASAMIAIGSLQLTPESLASLVRSEPAAVDQRSDMFFSTLVAHLNPGKRPSIVQCARRWPDCIADPLLTAVADARSPQSRSHLLRSLERTVAYRGRFKILAEKSVALHNKHCRPGYVTTFFLNCDVFVAAGASNSQRPTFRSESVSGIRSRSSLSAAANSGRCGRRRGQVLNRRSQHRAQAWHSCPR